jgi:hypothetical protein
VVLELAIFCEIVASQLVWAFMPITEAFIMLPLIDRSLRLVVGRLNIGTLARS